MEILELRNTITEMKSPVDGLHDRIERAEQRISELEDRTIRMTQSEEQRHRLKKKNDQSLRDLRTIIKYLTFVSLEAWKEKRKRMELKNYTKK